VMAGVPSIVMGLFIFTVYVLPRGGVSGLGGALALACLMLPIVIRATEGMLGLVPDELRDAAYALGTSKSRTIVTVVLPAALPGITSGALLAVARAAGETAPLLFTALGNRFWSTSLVEPIASLPIYIFDYARAPYDEWNRQAWTAALVLVLLVTLVSAILRLTVRRIRGG
jgi:phosphate transport system permease protein